MGMLIKNATHPFANGEQKHVVTVGIRPVGYGHAGLMAGDQTAQTQEQEASNVKFTVTSVSLTTTCWVDAPALR